MPASLLEYLMIGTLNTYSIAANITDTTIEIAIPEPATIKCR